MAHALTEEHRFCLEGCRSYTQYYNMRKGFEKRACVFCPEHFDRTYNEVLWEDYRAIAWHVRDELLRTALRLHIIVIPKRHVRFESDLTDAEVLSIHRAKCAMHKRFKYTGGLVHAREGDMRLNAGTVPHLHYNIFQVNKSGEVRIPIFKKTAQRKENIARAAAFAQRYYAGEIPQ